MYREAKIRATNAIFIFWDVCYPLVYLLVFGVGMTHAVGFAVPGTGADYNAFFLAGVLSMASFGIASNTSWSFFLDRDSGIFFEMLTYPLSRGAFLVGKVLFNVVVAVVQSAITIALAAWLLHVPLQLPRLPLVAAAVVLGTAGCVAHPWLIDPIARTLEVLHLESGRWSIAGTHLGDETVRADPFADVERPLGALWAEE